MTETETSYSGEAAQMMLCVAVETQSERLMRLSNRCADVVAQVFAADQPVQISITTDDFAEMADVLARLSRVASVVETLSNFD